MRLNAQSIFLKTRRNEIDQLTKKLRQNSLSDAEREKTQTQLGELLKEPRTEAEALESLKQNILKLPKQRRRRIKLSCYHLVNLLEERAQKGDTKNKLEKTIQKFISDPDELPVKQLKGIYLTEIGLIQPSSRKLANLNPVIGPDKKFHIFLGKKAKK